LENDARAVPAPIVIDAERAAERAWQIARGFIEAAVSSTVGLMLRALPLLPEQQRQ